MTTLTAVVVARDEEDMLPGCLARLDFADEVVVVVDSRSADRTAELAAEAGCVVIPAEFDGFAELKNTGLRAATGDWVLVVDADERVTDPLRGAVVRALASPGATVAYRVPIENYFYGRHMRHGGWATERPIRLMRRSAGRFRGGVHEVLELESGAMVADLEAPLAHFSHRSIVQNLGKSAYYVELQARELAASGHPKVTLWRAARAAARTFAWRTLRRSGWRDGVPGVIEALYQPFEVLAVQMRLWELQQSPGIPDRYADLEKTLP